MQTTKTEAGAAIARAQDQQGQIVDGQFNYSCNGCGHTWSAHGRIKACAKCKSQDIRKSPRPMDGQGELPSNSRATKSATSGLTWCCLACEHTWRAGPGQKRCPECGVSEIEASIEGDAGDEPALAKPKSNGKAWKWGCDFAPGGEPRWCCPNCLEMVIQSVCPQVCKGCGEHGDPAQAFKPNVDHPQLPAETVPVKGETKAAAGETIVEIRHGDVEPHPDNPRKHFAQQGLDELAEGFKKVGIINALTVRRLPGGHRYQIIAGERRWRAAKIAKLATVPCRVVDITDEEAYEVMIRENLDREDLDEIEKARSYQLGLEKCGLTQAQFAARYKKSQEHVSNTIRLLALPEAWQQRLIQRQITATHARELLVIADLPAVLAKFEGVLKDHHVPLSEMSASDFRDDLADAIAAVSKPMRFEEYEGGSGCKFRPSKGDLERLDVRQVPAIYGDREKRAFNVEVWNELNLAAKRKRKEDKPKPSAKKKARNLYPSYGSPEYKEQQAEQDFGRMLRLEKCNAMGAQIADALKPEHNGLRDRLLLGLLLARDADQVLYEHLQKQLRPGKFKHHLSDGEALGLAIGVKQSAIGDLFYRALVAALAEQHEFHEQIGLTLLEWLAKELKVKPLAGWKPSLDFIKGFPKKRLPGLLAQFPDNARRTCGLEGDKLTAELVLSLWPSGLVPNELASIDEKGVVRKGPSKKKAKARA